MKASSLAFIFLLLSAERAWASAPAESQATEATEEVKEEPEVPAEEAAVSVDARSALLDAPETDELQTTTTSALLNRSNFFVQHKLLTVILVVGLALILWNAKVNRDLDIALEEEARRQAEEEEEASLPSAPEEEKPTLPSPPDKETPRPTPPAISAEETPKLTPPADLTEETPRPTPPSLLDKETPRPTPPVIPAKETPLSPSKSDDKMPAPPKALPGFPSLDVTKLVRRPGPINPPSDLAETFKKTLMRLAPDGAPPLGPIDSTADVSKALTASAEQLLKILQKEDVQALTESKTVKAASVLFQAANAIASATSKVSGILRAGADMWNSWGKDVVVEEFD
ncbi:hypothetical protein Emed_007282 [Eimeria media]